MTKFKKTGDFSSQEAEEQTPQKAYQRALRLLSVKGRFRTELEQRLRLELFSEEAIAYAIEKCNRIGYLNDEDRSQQKRSACARKGYGARRIAMELGQFLDDDGVENAMNDFDEKKALLEYLRKHPKIQPDPKAKLRLLRRGFSYSTIEEAFKEL